MVRESLGSGQATMDSEKARELREAVGKARDAYLEADGQYTRAAVKLFDTNGVDIHAARGLHTAARKEAVTAEAYANATKEWVEYLKIALRA